MDEESAALCLAGGVGLSTSEQCRLLRLSRSGYYRWRKERHAKPVDDGIRKAELDLANAVLEAWGGHPAFGYRKMGYYLRDVLGIGNATEKRVRRIYKRLGIKGIRPSFKTTRPPKGRFVRFPYLLKDKAISFVNQAWATDMTYIKLQGGMAYLTAVIDLYSRKILAWKLGNTMDTSFCLDVLHEAVSRYGIPSIFNTDCGSQYLSTEFIAALQGYGIQISNDSVGRCLDNVYVERSWRSIKYECIFLNDWKTMAELQDGLDGYIRMFNQERPHEGLGYQTPDEVYGKGCFPQGGDPNNDSKDVA